MKSVFVKLALAACITATAYGFFNYLQPAVFSMCPNFPFPLQPSSVICSGREFTIDYAYDPISSIYQDPHWLVWSFALYFGVFGILTLTAGSKALILAHK